MKRQMIRRVGLLLMVLCLLGSALPVQAAGKGVSAAQKKKIVKTVDKVIKSQKITAKTADKKALKKLFRYAKTKFQYARAPFGFNPSVAKSTKDWEYTYAKEMLGTKKGSCYHDAAAFAFLAQRATGLPVRICLGTSNAFQADKWQFHAWVEVKIGRQWYTYDTNAARKSELRKGKWYAQKRSSMEGKIYQTQAAFTVKL